MKALRWTSAALGLLSALTAVLFVLAPVNEDVTTYQWPTADPNAAQDAHTQSTVLPLVVYEPERLDVVFSCADARELGDGLLLSTTPPEGAPVAEPSPPGLVIETSGGAVSVRVGDTVLAEERLPSGACQWEVLAENDVLTVSLDGRVLTGSYGGSLNMDAPQAKPPQVNGLFTDLRGTPGQHGLRAAVTPDIRYESSPSALKIVLGVVSVASLLGALALLWRWEKPLVRRVPRLSARPWWRPTLLDGLVVGCLLVWLIIGAASVDDGYIIGMLKSAADTDYVGNYFRWFNAPEAPFGWFYELYRPLVEIGGATWVLRLPTVVLGVACWLLLDRALLRRFASSGPRRMARWATAAVLLVWFLPFDLGLRSEIWIAFGSLVVLALTERSLATRALTPFVCAVVVAGATVALAPTGPVGVTPLLAALPGFVGLVRRRRDLWPTLALVFGAGASALLLMFYDQSLSAVLHATEVRTDTLTGDPEWRRYETLFDSTQVEGALNRRMPLLLLWFSMALLALLLVFRRRPGIGAAPAQRLLIASVLSFAAFFIAPTKWTHHFGALTGIGTLLIAVTVHALVRGALRRSWEKSLALAALAVAVAVALAAPQRWWFLSSLNVKWARVDPGVANVDFKYVVLVGGFLLAVAGVVGLWRWLPGVGTFVVLVAIASVVLAVGTMAYAVVPRWDTYTTGRANLASLSGGSCGVEDWLTIEPDLGAGLLTPARGSVAARGFLAGQGWREDRVPPAPYGTPAALAWGSGGAQGTLTTAWYRLPPGAGAPDAPPLTVPIAGEGAVSAKVQFAGADGQVRRELPMRLGKDGEWRHARFEPGAAALVRVVAADHADGRGWLAVGAPRLPRVVPLGEYVPTSEPVMLDWVSAFTLPCRTPAPLTNGVTQPVRYQIGAGPAIEFLAGVSFRAKAGGPYAPLRQLATVHPIPVYLRGDKLFEPIKVYRYDYVVPMRNLTVSTG